MSAVTLTRGRNAAPKPTAAPAEAPKAAPPAKRGHPAIWICLEVVRLILLAILFPLGLLVFLTGPMGAFAVTMVFAPIYVTYMAVDALKQLAS
jgi:hypothetical protein